MNRWDQLQTSLRSGTIGRREFLAAAAAMGVVGSLTSHALAQVPKRGGHLVMGINQAGTTDSLDPATWTSDYTYFMGQQLYDLLTIVNEKSLVVPSLAESWEQKDGAKTWVFKIRKGVTFHNGKTLTPADVDLFAQPSSRQGFEVHGECVVNSVTDIVATASDEVTITLNSGDVDFPYTLADFHFVIGPEGTKWDGVGTGAFALESFEAGVRMLTKRFTNDWRKDRGYFDFAETIAMNDPTARLSSLLSGSAHVINRVPFSSTSRRLRRIPDFRSLASPAAATQRWTR